MYINSLPPPMKYILKDKPQKQNLSFGNSRKSAESISKIIVTTLDRIPNKVVDQVLDVVAGNTVRSRFIVNDIMAGLKSMLGGEIKTYTKLMVDSRKQALDRLIQEAEKMGADAVLNVRFNTAALGVEGTEQLAYGTAVKLKNTL